MEDAMIGQRIRAITQNLIRETGGSYGGARRRVGRPRSRPRGRGVLAGARKTCRPRGRRVRVSSYRKRSGSKVSAYDKCIKALRAAGLMGGVRRRRSVARRRPVRRPVRRRASGVYAGVSAGRRRVVRRRYGRGVSAGNRGAASHNPWLEFLAEYRLSHPGVPAQVLMHNASLAYRR